MKKWILLLFVFQQSAIAAEPCDEQLKNFGQGSPILTNFCSDVGVAKAVRNNTIAFDGSHLYAIGKHYLIRTKLKGSINETLKYYAGGEAELASHLEKVKKKDSMKEADVIAGSRAATWGEDASLTLKKINGKTAAFIYSPKEKKLFYYDLKLFGSISPSSTISADSTIKDGRVINVDDQSLMILDRRGPKNQKIDFSFQGPVLKFSVLPLTQWKLPIRSDLPLSCQKLLCYGISSDLKEVLRVNVNLKGEVIDHKSQPKDGGAIVALVFGKEALMIFERGGKKSELPFF